ncbi:hypothetical protein BGX31_008295 [Mortierella sp. GBA43]|nr:hypothetical protein BGX31_008295 [Mortierella sp. GBA43]
MDSLSHHRELVEKMSYHVVTGSRYMSIQFPNLKCLDAYNKDHPNLIWILPQIRPSLTELSIQGLDIVQEYAATFWTMCTQLVRLRIVNSNIAQPPAESNTCGCLVNISLTFDRRGMHGNQEEWINRIIQSPNIVTIDLHFLYPSDIIGDSRLRIPTGCSKLQELHLSGIEISDSESAKVIEGMDKAVVLDITFSNFGDSSLKALRRHYLHLRILNVWGHKSATSRMIVEIMASCPSLEMLQVDELKSQDIISQDSDDHQRRVLGRISQLVNLEALIIAGDYRDMDSMNLHLGLDCGLEQLATLQNLNTLGFLCMERHPRLLASADVKWMVNTWKNLKYVIGYLRLYDEDLGAILQEAEIEYDPVW